MDQQCQRAKFSTSTNECSVFLQWDSCTSGKEEKTFRLSQQYSQLSDPHRHHQTRARYTHTHTGTWTQLHFQHYMTICICAFTGLMQDVENSYLDPNYQCIKWQPHQQNNGLHYTTPVEKELWVLLWSYTLLHLDLWQQWENASRARECVCVGFNGV